MDFLLLNVAVFILLIGGASSQTIDYDEDDGPRFVFEEPISTTRSPKLTTAKLILLPRFLGKSSKENARTQQGVIDLKNGSTLTFTPNKLSPNSTSHDYKVSVEPSKNIHSITDQANTQAQTVNSFKPTISSLTIIQKQPSTAEQNVSQDSDVASRLLDGFSFPDDKLAKSSPTLTTTKIVITTITNSTTTITFSNDNSINSKNAYPTTLSETSSMTTTTVITTPIVDIKLESRTTG